MPMLRQGVSGWLTRMPFLMYGFSFLIQASLYCSASLRFVSVLFIVTGLTAEGPLCNVCQILCGNITITRKNKVNQESK